MLDAKVTCFCSPSTSCPVVLGSTSAKPRSASKCPFRLACLVHSAESDDSSFAVNGSRWDSPRLSEVAKTRSIVLVKKSLSPFKLFPTGGCIVTSPAGSPKSFGACILLDEENESDSYDCTCTRIYTPD